uniref:Putative lysophosphatidic acid acyltransferase n=1 Tax=Rhizophora mucronata TaxID=61149 RepID=A0A2P2M773_RHIMU
MYRYFIVICMISGVLGSMCDNLCSCTLYCRIGFSCLADLPVRKRLMTVMSFSSVFLWDCVLSSTPLGVYKSNTNY